MQTYHKVLLVLLSAAIGTLCAILLILYEKSKEREALTLPIEDRTHGYYSDDYPDGIRRYGHLEAHGDYTKLKLIIRTEKKDYCPDDPVDIIFFVRNDSDREVHIGPGFGWQHFFQFWQLFHSNSEEVLKTPKGETASQVQPRAPDSRWIEHGGGGYRYVKLQSGQERRIDQTRLNDYFDLTKPDTYELTCFLTKFIDGQYYETPLQSNTLTFSVLEEKTRKDEYPLPGESEKFPQNPPKGEEVFQQTTPPKNVFYVYDKDSNPMFIDVSPTTYYRQRGR